MIKNKRKQNYIIIFLIIFLLFGLSYAWYNVVVIGNDQAKTISIKASNLQISYIDGPELSERSIIPGDIVTKTFSIENTGDAVAMYKIAWKTLENNFLNQSNFIYNVVSTNGGGSLGQTQIPNSGNHLTIMNNISIAAGVTQSYTMSFQYLRTLNDQSLDKGSILTGTIEVLDINNKTTPPEISLGTNLSPDGGGSLYGQTVSSLLNTLYPIGSIYTSINSTNPENLFGGKWIRIHDTFLLAAGDTNPADDGTHTTFTAGSPNAVVVTHTHTTAANTYKIPGSNASWSTEQVGAISGTGHKLFQIPATDTYTYSTHTHNVLAPTNGVSGTGKNMPPYLTVYMWKRCPDSGC